jgi:hypothetical protein
MDLAEFSHYVVATKKRLIAHFGMSPHDADVAVNDYKVQLKSWYKRGVASDKAARMIADRKSEQAAYRENPLPTPVLWAAAAAMASIGVYFIARSFPVAQPPVTSVPPPALPNYSSSTPEVLQTLGPVGVQPETVSV